MTTAIEWIENHSKYHGIECLPYPFSRRGNGYGRLYYKGKHTTASKVMCLFAHGNPPSEKHQAAHSCRGASGGCVNPNHLRWATQIENDLDKIEHGTKLLGEQLPWAKLTKDDVLLARKMQKDGHTHQSIADIFNVKRETISSLIWRKSWKHI